MYNPEIALQRTQDLCDDEMRLARVVERLGMNHPWTQRVALVTDICKAISQKEDDLDNCFDSNEQSAIENEIEQLILIAQETLKKP